MISLCRIVEYAALQGQTHDPTLIFRDFLTSINNAEDQVTKKFQDEFNKLYAGKRVRAKASKGGYGQDQKDYEFDVSNITIQDYYGRFVIIGHDKSDPKKERKYYIDPLYQIQIVGPATTAATQSSPQQPSAPQPPSQPSAPTQQVKENNVYEAYSIESIEEDIATWIKPLVKDPSNELREFIKSVGWKKNSQKGGEIAMYDVVIPKESVKLKLTKEHVTHLFNKNPDLSKGIHFIPVDFKDTKEYYKVRVKKVTDKKKGTQDDQSGK